jgi:predicted Zn-dependent peptidase
MEHMVLGANKKFPNARVFQAEFQKNGAYNNAYTSTYSLGYEAQSADFEWERILDLLLLSIAEPLFLEAEFKAEYGNVREELTGYTNNHGRELYQRLNKEIGLLSVTDKERMKMMRNVSMKDIEKHYKKTHTTDNMRFIIAGNIPPKRNEIICKALETIKLPRGERYELPNEKVNHLPEPLYMRKKNVQNLQFEMGTLLNSQITRHETDVLDHLDVMLTATLHSLILGEAREKGLAYSMGSSSIVSQGFSNWGIGTQVSYKNAPALFEIIVRQIKNVLDGNVEEHDLDAAKQYSLGRFQRSVQTVGGLAGGYAGPYYFDGFINDYYSYPDRIKATTKEEVVAVMQKMFEEKLWYFGVVGNCEKQLVTALHQQIAALWN